LTNWNVEVCPKPPFKSEELLKKIQQNGSVTCVLYYLEYLTLKCNIQEKKLHTELACLFVHYISLIVGKAGPHPDLEKLKREDKTVKDLRQRLRLFLTKSVLYEPMEVERLVVPPGGEGTADRKMLAIKFPVRALLAKELAILKMRIGKVRECFEICVQEVEDVDFAQTLAKIGVEWLQRDHRMRGQDWHQNDRLIWYNLFKRLMEAGEAEQRAQAVQILTKNCEHIPYKSICQNFNDEDELDPEVNILFQKIFESMSSNLKQSQIMKSLSEVQKHNLDIESYEFSNQYIRIASENDEAGPGEHNQQATVTKRSTAHFSNMCSICGKPIENAPVVYNPEDNTIVHSYHLEHHA